MKLLRILLFPFALLYSTIVFMRNRFFDWGISQSREGGLPTIVIGNLSTGGTGKTPHIEFLIEILQKAGVNFAILSRGYGRKTKGFILADSKASAHTIGDEPFQIHSKFPDIPLAVSEDRLLGISNLKQDTIAEFVLLDDAFQHRKLKGNFNILLTTYDRPFWKDFSLPTGNLRDNKFEKRRADVIIVTKCPTDLSILEQTKVITSINPEQHQHVFFSTLEYGRSVQLNGKPMAWEQIENVLGFAGIAHPELFEQFLSQTFNLKKFKSFPDHYIFSQSDIKSLADECGKFGLPEIALITTEKDAMRLKALNGLPQVPVFYVPVKVKMLNRENQFIELLLERISQHKR